jgi:aspartate/tyrosine/aromatic aminotransferase
MCKKCRTITINKIGKDTAERVHKVHVLKEKWAKEKERKFQQYREMRDAELRIVKALCQQAVFQPAQKDVPFFYTSS